MSIQDYRDREAETDLRKEALTPRPLFLVAAAIFGLVAFLVLLFSEEIQSVADNGFRFFFPILLIVLVGAAAFMVACYRSPALGARLIGYDAVLNPERDAKRVGFKYSTGFGVESAGDKKRAASKRLSARQTRRKYARSTQIQQGGKVNENTLASHGADAADNTE